MVAVTITESTRAFANAMPPRPIPLFGNPPFTTTTAAPTNTSPNVPSASAVKRRAREGMRHSFGRRRQGRERRESRTLFGAPEEETGVDSAEPKGVAEQVVRLEWHPVRGHMRQIAAGIGRIQVDGGRHPAPPARQGADRRLNGSTGPQRVAVITLCPAEREPICVLAEDLLDRGGLGWVIERGRRSVGVDVTHLVRRHSCFGQCVAHRSGGLLSIGPWCRHMVGIVGETEPAYLCIDRRAARERPASLLQ